MRRIPFEWIGRYFYLNLYSMNFRILHWVDYFVSDIMTEIIRFPNSKNLLSPELQGWAGQLPVVHRQHFQTVISFRYNCSIHHRLCFNGFANHNQFFSVSQKKNLTQFFHRICDNLNEDVNFLWHPVYEPQLTIKTKSKNLYANWLYLDWGEALDLLKEFTTNMKINGLVQN